MLRNVALPLELIGVSRIERLAAAMEALRQVGLSDAIQRYPAQLSGGMRMCVFAGAALVTEPNFLLLDEPFAALDEITRQKLDEHLRELWLRHRMTRPVRDALDGGGDIPGESGGGAVEPARAIGADFTIDLPARRGSLRRSRHSRRSPD